MHCQYVRCLSADSSPTPRTPSHALGSLKFPRSRSSNKPCALSSASQRPRPAVRGSPYPDGAIFACIRESPSPMQVPETSAREERSVEAYAVPSVRPCALTCVSYPSTPSRVSSALNLPAFSFTPPTRRSSATEGSHSVEREFPHPHGAIFWFHQARCGCRWRGTRECEAWVARESAWVDAAGPGISASTKCEEAPSLIVLIRGRGSRSCAQKETLVALVMSCGWEQ
ncbi:hypothetical protein B0H13DRAFT_2340939 [Mycena leptocephala]|nr:hypothetical protein B0H13DRAFT_2340939 [Mycena leptocephala]